MACPGILNRRRSVSGGLAVSRAGRASQVFFHRAQFVNKFVNSRGLLHEFQGVELEYQARVVAETHFLYTAVCEVKVSQKDIILEHALVSLPICRKSYPSAAIPAIFSRIPFASLARIRSTIDETISSGLRPISSRTVLSVILSSGENDITWSSMLNESLSEPFEIWAISWSALLSMSNFSSFESFSRCVEISTAESGLNLNLWQRESIVNGIFCGSVVASMKITCSGGSSSVLRSALKAASVIWWASSIM